MRLTFLGHGHLVRRAPDRLRLRGLSLDRSAGQADPVGALVEADGATLLIDTPPELRLQLLAGGFTAIDAVLYTHEHADHVNGIDDLRIFSVRQRRAAADLRAAGDAGATPRRRSATSSTTRSAPTRAPRSRSSSCIRSSRAGRCAWPGSRCCRWRFEHGHLRVFGYRIGPLAYLTDVKAIPEAERAQLRGLDVLVLNALWWRPHPDPPQHPRGDRHGRARSGRGAPT